MKYLSYLIFTGVAVGLFLRIMNIYSYFKFNRELKRRLRKEQRIRRRLKSHRAGIELVDELLRELTIKHNLEKL